MAGEPQIVVNVCYGKKKIMLPEWKMEPVVSRFFGIPWRTRYRVSNGVLALEFDRRLDAWKWMRDMRREDRRWSAAT